MGNFISFPTVQDATLLDKWNSRYGCFSALLFSIYEKDRFFLFLSMSTSSLGCQRMIIHLEEIYMLDVGAPISSLLKGGSQAKSVVSWWTTKKFGSTSRLIFELAMVGSSIFTYLGYRHIQRVARMLKTKINSWKELDWFWFLFKALSLK